MPTTKRRPASQMPATEQPFPHRPRCREEVLRSSDMVFESGWERTRCMTCGGEVVAEKPQTPVP